MSAIITRNGLGVVALLLCVACDPAPAPTQSESARPSVSVSATAATPAPKKIRTTSAEIAARGVESKIRDYEKQLAAQPKDLTTIHTLLSLHLTRSSRLGQIGSLDRVVDLGDRAIEATHKQQEALLVRATAHSAVHRFADALADMDKAEELGASTYKTELSRAAILIALGRVDEGLAIIVARRKKQGDSFEVLLAEAMALGHMNRYTEADKLYDEALAKFHNISPFPVALLEFERGSMWDRAGDEKRAEQYYRSAVERLPQFAHAAGHLLYKLPHDEGVAMAKKLIETSDDPEYVGALGYLMNNKEPGSGDVHVAKAKEMYAELLKKHPLAFADHAGWFYVLIAKDYARAIELADMNLDNRPTPEAFELMLAALVGANHGTEACEMADRALAVKYPTPGLKRYAASAYMLCGRDGEAKDLRAKI